MPADIDGGDAAGRADPATNGDATAEADPGIDDLIAQLESLEETVDDPHERREVRQTLDLVERLPGSGAFTRRVKNYTSRDVAEGLVGGIIFSLPLLVEDGVFEIAEWFVEPVGPLPVFLLANAVFVFVMVVGLLYYTDFRDVRITRPILGFIPRRLVGLLVSSFLLAAGLMYLWGRLEAGDPTRLEALGRITVVWTAAALGAALGDILPGESQGADLATLWDGDDGPVRAG